MKIFQIFRENKPEQEGSVIRSAAFTAIAMRKRSGRHKTMGWLAEFKRLGRIPKK